MTGSAVRALKVAAAGMAVAGAVGVASADASHVVRIASHISIKSRNLTFHGRVTSPNHACMPMRKVTLYRTNGDVLGHTHTNHRGHWRITASGSAGISLGRFYAKVSRTSQGAAGTIYVCKGARSRTIPVHSTANDSY
jgi:hypothetical protein